MKYLTGVLVLLFAFLVRAQDELPDLPRELLNPVRSLLGDSIRFCYYPFSPTAKIDKEIAGAIAESLLLDVSFVEASTAIEMENLDIIPIGEADLYLFLSNDCDAFLGFTIASDVYPDWLVLSEGYLGTRFVGVALNETYDTVNELPGSAKIGSLMMTEADIQLGRVNRSKNEESRWKILPYTRTDLLVDRLIDGTVDVAVGWEPTLLQLLDNENVDYFILSLEGLNVPSRKTGIAMLEAESFLLNEVDSAISALIANGDIKDILQAAVFPGRPPTQE